MSAGKHGSTLDHGFLEKGEAGKPHIVASDDKYRFDAHDLDRVQRRLKQRHIQMIAIAGTIGTGFFLSSGSTLKGAGPAGALIAYLLVGSVAYATLCSLSEMTTWAPISGTFPHFAARWVDPALGFAVGWNYFYAIAISIPTEVSASTVLLTFWDPNAKHTAIYTVVICFGICAINILGVRWFGESEFIFAIIKVSLIIALLLAGLIVDLGGGPDHERIGFRFWNHPGAFNRAGLVTDINTDRFLAWLGVLVNAAFSFGGVELVAVAASETQSPRRNVAKAVDRVFWRILIFYVFGIIMIGMLVAYNDEALLQDTGTAAQSPFVIAMSRAGVKIFPHIINACIFTSGFSAGNSSLFSSSRILYGLSLRGQAPRYLMYCTKNGLPLAAVLTTSVFVFLSFMSISKGAETVFHWLVSLTTVGGFLSWCSVNFTYTRFYAGLNAQGIDPKSNVYHNRLQPYLAYWAIFWLIIAILTSGIKVFFNWNTAGFLTAYINIPIFVGLYAVYKIVKRSKFWRASEMDFYTGVPTLEETEIPQAPPRNFFEKVAEIIF